VASTSTASTQAGTGGAARKFVIPKLKAGATAGLGGAK